jgi:hypothetical protein
VVGVVYAAVTRKEGRAYGQCVTLLSRLGIREPALDPSNTLFIRRGVNLGRKAVTRKEIGRRMGNMLGRLLIGITSGTGSHEPRTRGTAFSHAQSLRHCPDILPALKAQ